MPSSPSLVTSTASFAMVRLFVLAVARTTESMLTVTLRPKISAMVLPSHVNSESLYSVARKAVRVKVRFAEFEINTDCIVAGYWQFCTMQQVVDIAHDLLQRDI